LRKILMHKSFWAIPIIFIFVQVLKSSIRLAVCIVSKAGPAQS
jgi:hypothetical protein